MLRLLRFVRLPLLVAASAAAASMTALACGWTDSSASSTGATNDGDGGGGTADNNNDSDGGGSTGDGGDPSACASSTPIYLVDDDGYLKTFDPSTLAADDVKLAFCTDQQTGAYMGLRLPFAVSHDRYGWFMDKPGVGGSGMKWVYLPLDPSVTTCPNPRFSRTDSQGIVTTVTYGATSPSATKETLYAVVSDSQTSYSLASMDPTNGVSHTIGALPERMWIAGTADGRLFGVQIGTVSSQPPYVIYDVNPATGDSSPIGSVPAQGPIAVARGQLFIFGSVPGGARGETDVYSFDPKTKQTTKRTHLAFAMGGAGTPTCIAP